MKDQFTYYVAAECSLQARVFGVVACIYSVGGSRSHPEAITCLRYYYVVTAYCDTEYGVSVLSSVEESDMAE
jgi:hypothetical protein